MSTRTPEPGPFDQPPNAAAITLRRIVLPENGQTPRRILLVTHDEDDHGWLFLDGDALTTEDAAIFAMEEMLAHDPTLAEIADLPPGWTATRTTPGGPWTRSRSDPQIVEERAWQDLHPRH